MYQQITLIGHVGNDPEMRFTPSGVPVTGFRMAVKRTWTGQDGQRQEKTTWFSITCWRKLAEIVSQYLTKGRQVLVIGEVEDARPFTDRDGNLRASLEITANVVKFLGGRDEASAYTGGSAAAETAPAGDEALSDADIPF